MRAQWALWILAGAGAASGAELLDRMAATVGDYAITTSAVVRQLRLEAFLDGRTPDLSPDSRRQAAQRLVEQQIVRREMELTRYPLPAVAEVDPVLARLRKEARFAGPGRWEAALAAHRFTEEDLRQELLWILAVTNFVGFRFRTGPPRDAEIRTYYNQTFVPEQRRRQPGQPVTSLEEARPEIEVELSARMADDAMDRWMKQARAQVRVKFYDEAFR